jgi:segregation and condensation protein A
MSEYRVKLDVFAGPLDLLLYLVRKEEVDIYDIPIARITAQYVEYIEMLKALDIDLAGDFLVMAATLMEIKSVMLLPRPEDGPEQEGTLEDPRAELVRQLLEYKRFKDAANLLDASAQSRQQRYTRPPSILEKLKPSQEPEVDLEQVSIWTLLEAFDGIMKATGHTTRYDHIKDDTPIDLYQIEVLHRLQSEGPMSMAKVFEGRKNRLVMIGLFLGILELIRNRLIWAEQPEGAGEILLKPLTSEPAEEAVPKAIYADHLTEPEDSELHQVAPSGSGQEGQAEQSAAKPSLEQGRPAKAEDKVESAGRAPVPIKEIPLPEKPTLQGDVDAAVEKNEI